jgi:hypothetical protein
MQQKEKVVYQPLMWSIAAVEMCDRHHRRLLERCPHCHRQIFQLTRRIQLGYCSRCGYWLGEETDKHTSDGNQITEKDLNWQKFVVSNVKRLLATMPNLDGSISKEILVESLRVCVVKATGGNISHFAALIGKPLTTFYGWYLGKVKIPLPEMLRICYCLNITILDLLRGAAAIERN